MILENILAVGWSEENEEMCGEIESNSLHLFLQKETWKYKFSSGKF